MPQLGASLCVTAQQGSPSSVARSRYPSPSASWAGPVHPSASRLDSVTPSRRTPSGDGNNGRSRSRLIRSSVGCVAIGPACDRLRVICWKSAYFSFTVTVRPACPPRLQASQTLANTGASAGATSSQPSRSRLKVVSVPTDLRTRSACTGRSSTPRATPNR